MIEVSELIKDYGAFRALHGVSFRVDKGEVVGFLGPNGAGKTTCMKIITGFISATSGRVTIADKDVVEHGVEVRRRIGYLPENSPVYQDMTVREYLRFVAQVRGVADKDVARRLEAVAATTGIGHVLHQEIGTLSKGYRQRTGLAQAMIHDPEILILDEPTSGLDPNQIVEIRQVIKELGRDRTVILSTHNLPEVTATCTRIIVIHRGRIAADGDQAHIQATFGGGNTYLVELAQAGAAEAAAKAIAGVPAVKGAFPVDRPGAQTTTLRVEADGDADVRGGVFECCVRSGWTLLELKRERLELETIFQRLTLS